MEIRQRVRRDKRVGKRLKTVLFSIVPLSFKLNLLDTPSLLMSIPDKRCFTMCFVTVDPSSGQLQEPEYRPTFGRNMLHAVLWCAGPRVHDDTGNW
jgi:hypothetical protein